MGSARGRVRELRGGRKCCALEGGGGSGFAGDFGLLGWGMRVAEGMGMMDSLLTNPTMRMLEQTVNFTEQAGKTLVQFRQETFPTTTLRDNHQDGWTTSFGRLDNILAAQATAVAAA